MGGHTLGATHGPREGALGEAGGERGSRHEIRGGGVCECVRMCGEEEA